MAKRKWSAPVSIKDVAKEVGVSASTVSRVMNDHPDVSEAMADRVKEAMARLDYEPDYLAQSLRGGFTRTVGFVLRDLSNPIFADIVKGCETTLRERGYAIILTNSDGDAELDERNVRVLRQRRVDGLILSLQSEQNEDLSELLADLDIPIVFIDRELHQVPAAMVRCDHRAGVSGAIRHLVQLGHRRIGMISGPADIFATRARLEGYEGELAAAGVDVDRRLICLGSYSQEFAHRETHALMAGDEPPTAIFAAGVQLAEGTLLAFRELGLTAGTDVSLVAGDDTALLSLMNPAVSVVRRDTALIGQMAGQLLVEMIVEKKPPREAVIPTTYVARDTSQPPR